MQNKVQNLQNMGYKNRWHEGRRARSFYHSTQRWYFFYASNETQKEYSNINNVLALARRRFTELGYMRWMPSSGKNLRWIHFSPTCVGFSFQRKNNTLQIKLNVIMIKFSNLLSQDGMCLLSMQTLKWTDHTSSLTMMTQTKNRSEHQIDSKSCDLRINKLIDLLSKGLLT